MLINKKTITKTAIIVEFDEAEAIHISNWLVTHTVNYKGDIEETKILLEFVNKLNELLLC